LTAWGFMFFCVVYVYGETGMMIALLITMDSKGEGFRNNRSWLYAPVPLLSESEDESWKA